jgi:cell division transport system ATP-binding protein
MIEYRKISVVYPNNIQALRNIDLQIEKGEFVFVIGPTGSGKSTLLSLINREERPTSGAVYVAGKDLAKMRGGAVARLRRTIGVVFQDYRLLPQKTAAENIAFALFVTGTPRKEINRRVSESLELVGLADRAGAYPHELSGGEQQRVSVARAIVNNPQILIADEPTGNLDPDTSWEITQILERINIRGTTVIVASHDQHIIDRMQTRVITIEDGVISRDVKEGTYHEFAKS